MRTSAKLITALSVAGLIGIAGSAFTAASTIDSAQKYVGATSQTISGVNVSSVQYTTNTSTDVTSAVAFHVAQELGAETDVTATITGTSTGGTPTPGTTSASTCVAEDNGAGTDLLCTFTTPLSNVVSLSIVAS
jgi:hypothetical protein